MPQIELDDVSIHYERFGIGPPLLFLHSHYSRPILAFSHQLLTLEAEWDCILPDFRGHGRSISRSPSWDSRQLARDMIEMIALLDLPEVHLLGYSAGAGVALMIAASIPERITSVVTIGTSSIPTPEGADDFTLDALRANGQDAFVASMLSRHHDAHQGDVDTFLAATVHDWKTQPDLTDTEMANVFAPVLAISGENDPFCGVDGLTRLRGRLSSTTVETSLVAGGTHRPHIDPLTHQQTTDSITRFLRAHR